MSSVNSDDEQPQRWVPTHVQVTVLRGRGLRGKGKNGTSDVYTIIQVGKEKYSTCVVEKTTSPEWKEECSFELLPGVLEEGGRGAYPPGSCDLVLTVMHRALIGLDVFLGQAVIPLDKAFQDHIYAKTEAEWVNLRSRWFRLNSKTGKKEKERGEVQATVQFTRNNLTASMYHLAMKDKGHSAFSKLKERMRGKKRSSVDDDAPAPPPPPSGGGGGGGGSLPRTRLPSDGGGEEEYEDDEGGEGRRNKMRTFFLRGKLRKSSETRSSTSLGSESSESSSRGGSLSPTAGISVVVSDLSNSPSNSSNLTADNSPEHTADTSPKLSPDDSEFGDDCHEISIAVPALYRNGGVHHAYHAPPPQPGPGEPLAPAAAAAAAAKASPLGLGLHLKPLPTSVSLQNISPREEELPRGAGSAGDGRRWSFDKPGEDEKAAIAAALEKSGPMVGDDEEEEEEERSRSAAPPGATGAARESYDRKQQQQQQQKKKKGDSGGRLGSEAAPQEKTGKGWFGSKECNSKPSPHPVRPLTPGSQGPEERRGPDGRSVLEKLRCTIQPGRSSQLSEAEPERRKSLTEGAGSYYHLTHNELVALLVGREADLERQKAEFERQTALLSRREVELRRLKPQVRDLENYIDTLLVRIMEQTPTLLQVGTTKFK
ncbi:rab11 family-interacting protein 5 isoform X4 [Gadus macrocephalus]|uniref:rab11 family-interacting protein 5 isoform X4 n=1 Tax=Gadus macrocephalus TaxID=80720 RepID=UPI0028CB57E4|nr:rab11 family-interacting protein 5 isoform X4 [Gadus macrocephalus]